MASVLRKAKELAQLARQGRRSYAGGGGAALSFPEGQPPAPEVLFPRPSGQGFMRDADGRIFGPRFPFNYPPSAGYYDGWNGAYNGAGAGGEHWFLAYFTWVYPWPVMYMYYVDKAKREAAGEAKPAASSHAHGKH